MLLLTCLASATPPEDEHHVGEGVDEEGAKLAEAATPDLQIDEHGELGEDATFATFSKASKILALRPFPMPLSL